MKRRNTIAVLILTSLLLVPLAALQAEVTNLRCEYRTDPLGIDAAKPRLSWILTDGRGKRESRGQKQTAYQVLVASTPELLAKGQGDLWDSGKVASDATTQIEYAGKPLPSRQQCFWKVKTWLSDGARSESKPASWEMGLLKPDDWKAKWIGYDAAYQTQPDASFTTAGLKWVRPNQSKAATFTINKDFDLPTDRSVRRAVLALFADNECTAAVNGSKVGTAVRWEATARLDVASRLKPGANTISLAVSNSDFLVASVIGRLIVQFTEGADLVMPVDTTWTVTAGGEFKLEAAGTPWGTPAMNDHPRIPAPYLRKEFMVEKKVKRATAYVTALGAYQLHLNGQRVGNDELTPGWTEFKKRVQYQTYDVTAQVCSGKNALGAILGDGWYASDLAFTGKRNYYGGKPRLLAQLIIEYTDGSTQTVATDADWKAAYGPIRHADLMMGCEYDTRLAMPGWDKAGFADANWSQVNEGRSDETGGAADVTAKVAAAVKEGRLSFIVANNSLGGDPSFGKVKALDVTYRLGGQEKKQTWGEGKTVALEGADLKILSAIYGSELPSSSLIVEAANAEPSRRHEELPTLRLTESKPGVFIFDLGQNMVGWAKLRLRGSAGQRITVRYGEMLNPDGTLYTANLRGATATDYFILSGKGEETLEPYFTFHGFRYVELRGLAAKPDLGAVTGIVIHSAMERTGTFECSSPLINQLYHNIIWGQKGNYLEVPTDCPQRDERAGWSGDTQFFIPTAAYNFNVEPFFTRWLTTICEDSQHADGSIANVSPDLNMGSGVTAWGDAGLICTYNIYRAYGNTRVIAQHFPALERLMAWYATKSNGLVPKIGGFGDWLNLGGSASREVIDTAYYAYQAELMAEMAQAIGNAEAATRYAKLHDDIKSVFAGFFDADGTLRGCSQTGYALAFSMNLVPAGLREKAAEKFVGEIKRFNWHLATGFIGTPRLLPGLHEAGQDASAYRLLLQETYPSWLFQVKLGATTMWERWNGWTPEHGFEAITMNSFNHYAFGAVGEYLYAGLAGICAESPAYKQIRIQPTLGDGITWVNSGFDSPCGHIVSNWAIEGGKLTMDVTIPINTTATVYVPAKDAAGVSESGKPVDQAGGVKFLRMENNAAVYAVGSGTYRFQSTLMETIK